MITQLCKYTEKHELYTLFLKLLLHGGKTIRKESSKKKPMEYFI